MIIKNIYPSNKSTCIELIDFCQDIVRLCNSIKVNPILYGSLAYLAYTKDKNIQVKDIDLFIRESDFPKVINELKRRKIKHKYIKKWHTLHVKKKDLKIELDSRDFWYKGKSKFINLSINGLKIKALSPEALKEVYKIASQVSNKKRSNLKKYELLDTSMNKDIIKSKSFTLRRPRKTDLDSFHKSKNDKEIAKNLVFFKLPYSKKDAKNDLDKLMNLNKHNTYDIFIIDINGECVGEIGIVDIIPKLKGKIYYWVGKKHRGKGIITEALKLMSSYAFKKYKLRRIYGWARTHNKSSARVLDKAGYKLEGVSKKNVLKNGRYYDDFLYAKVR